MEDVTDETNLQDCHWTQLVTPPVHNYEIPIPLNSTEFLLVPESKYCDSEGKCLYKYDTINNEWISIMKYDNDIIMSYHTASFNQTTQILYIHTAERTLMKMDLKNMEVVEIIEELHDGSFASSLIIDNKFHVFGGWHGSDANHFIWNEFKKRYDVMHHFSGSFNDHGTVYIKSQNRILVFGGASAKIYSCSLDTYKWTESMTKWPVRFGKFCPGYALTFNEKYIILFIDNEIFVFSLDTMQFYRSNIAVAGEAAGRRKCIIMDHRLNAKLLVFGYVKEIWNEYSLDVVAIIVSYYANEYLHVLQASYNHFSIRVDDIINNMQSDPIDALEYMNESNEEYSTSSDY